MNSKKANVSLKFKSRLQEDKLLIFSINVHTRITENSAFSTISEEDKKALGDANTAYENLLKKAVKGSTLDTANKNAGKELVVIGLLNKIAQTVNVIANGEEPVILLAGFEVRKQAARREADPSPITDLVVQPMLVAGEVHCKWTKSADSNKTAFEWTEEVEPRQWHNGEYSDGGKLLIKGLPSKKNVLIRARALGSGNRKSEWSEALPVFVY
jgi:hypothetical protein